MPSIIGMFFNTVKFRIEEISWLTDTVFYIMRKKIIGFICVIHTLARQLRLPVFWLKFTYLSIFQALFLTQRRRQLNFSPPFSLSGIEFWNFLRFRSFSEACWVFFPFLYRKCQTYWKVETYTEHPCTYQLDSTINILYYFLNHVSVHLSNTLSIYQCI